MKRCSMSLVIWEIQIKTEILYTNKNGYNQNDNSQDVKHLEFLYTVDLKCDNFETPFWFLKKLNTHLPHEAAASVPRYLPKRNKRNGRHRIGQITVTTPHPKTSTLRSLEPVIMLLYTAKGLL